MDIDYKKLGLKCGIEIHQQLDTHKLFCNCPSQIIDDKPDVIVKRKMRAVAGELGDVDPAALYEFLRNRNLVYEAYSDTNCLVELDEEPPHELNKNALDIVLEISLLLNAKIIPELQVMRKTVIDGSNTSGFQRTLLVAMDGFIETSLGKVKIPTICLEEDAARKIKEEGIEIRYRLDRLGIPLVEIATSPDIKSPEHAREVAEKLGRILRATGKVKRGLGTIRQDLNISISEGERIEVKGVQDLRLIPKFVKLEVGRQLMLIGVKNELEKRVVKKSDIKENIFDLTEIFRRTNSEIIKNFVDKNGVVLAIKLKNFAGLLKGKLGPELTQYARGAEVKGIFHSDELPAYGISEKEVAKVKNRLNLKENDAFVLIAEKKEKARNAMEEVIQRAKLAFNGVPKETRKAKKDGTTEFMRPLPGSSRMYPETDEPPIEITEEKIAKIRKNLPKLPDETINELLKIGLGKELSEQLSKSESLNVFWNLVKKFPNIKPSIVATTLISTPKEVKKKFKVDVEKITEEHYESVLNALNKGEIAKESIPEILAELTKHPSKEVNDIIKEKNLQLLSQKELEKVIDKILKENLEHAKKLGDKAENFLFGRCMTKLRGRASINKIRETLKKELNRM